MILAQNICCHPIRTCPGPSPQTARIHLRTKLAVLSHIYKRRHELILLSLSQILSIFLQVRTDNPLPARKRNLCPWRNSPIRIQNINHLTLNLISPCEILRVIPAATHIIAAYASCEYRRGIRNSKRFQQLRRFVCWHLRRVFLHFGS